MSMLVNRTPVSDEDLTAIKSELLLDASFLSDTISEDDVTEDGHSLIRALDVQGAPADGLTLHGTRSGREWCAYRTVD